MKKIINGKVYDTEKAKAVGEWSNSLGYRDFNWKEETLYRKKTGEFFLFGEGGPNTNYAERIDTNSWSSGSVIIPMTYGEAMEWAEKKLDGDTYESIFGKVEEDENKRVVAYNLSTSTIETIKRRAAEVGISASAYIESLIN